MTGTVVWSRRAERYSTDERAPDGSWVFKTQDGQDGQYDNLLATVHAGRTDAMMGGVELREHFNYPGGPGFSVEHLPKAEQKWPVVTLRISLPVGRMDLRDELTSTLKAVTEAFLVKHNLLGDAE